PLPRTEYSVLGRGLTPPARRWPCEGLPEQKQNTVRRSLDEGAAQLPALFHLLAGADLDLDPRRYGWGVLRADLENGPRGDSSIPEQGQAAHRAVQNPAAPGGLRLVLIREDDGDARPLTARREAAIGIAADGERIGGARLRALQGFQLRASRARAR